METEGNYKETKGNHRKPLETKGNHWDLKGNHGKPFWKTIGKPLENHGKQLGNIWKTIRTHGKPWKDIEIIMNTTKKTLKHRKTN